MNDNAEFPFPTPEIPAEDGSFEDSVSRLSWCLSREPDFYPWYHLCLLAHLYLSRLTGAELRTVYERLGASNLAVFMEVLASGLSKYGPDDSHAVIGQITPALSAHLTMRSFPLAPARLVLGEL